jgi:hypothetical protein
VAIRSATSHVIHAPPHAPHTPLFLVEAEVVVAVAVRYRGLQLQLQFDFGVAWLLDLPSDIDPAIYPDKDPDIQPRWDCDNSPDGTAITAPMGLR